jgi:hypothetical protein
MCESSDDTLSTVSIVDGDGRLRTCDKKDLDHFICRNHRALTPCRWVIKPTRKGYINRSQSSKNVPINWHTLTESGPYVDSIWPCPSGSFVPDELLRDQMTHILHEHIHTQQFVSRMDKRDPNTSHVRYAISCIHKALEHIFKEFPDLWKESYGTLPQYVMFPHDELDDYRLRLTVVHFYLMNYIVMFMNMWGRWYDIDNSKLPRQLSKLFGYIIKYMFGGTHPDDYVASILPTSFFNTRCTDGWCLSRGEMPNNSQHGKILHRFTDNGTYITSFPELITSCIVWMPKSPLFEATASERDGVLVNLDTRLWAGNDCLLEDGIFPKPGTPLPTMPELHASVFPDGSNELRWKIRLLLGAIDDGYRMAANSWKIQSLMRHLRVAIECGDDAIRKHAVSHIGYYVQDIKPILSIVLIIANLFLRYLDCTKESCEGTLSGYCADILRAIYDTDSLLTPDYVDSLLTPDHVDDVPDLQLSELIDAIGPIVDFNSDYIGSVVDILNRPIKWWSSRKLTSVPVLGFWSDMMRPLECVDDAQYTIIMKHVLVSLYDELDAMRKDYRYGCIHEAVNLLITYIFDKTSDSPLLCSIPSDLIITHCFNVIVLIVGTHLLIGNIIQSEHGDCDVGSWLHTRLGTVLDHLFSRSVDV